MAADEVPQHPEVGAAEQSLQVARGLLRRHRLDDRNGLIPSGELISAEREGREGRDDADDRDGDAERAGSKLRDVVEGPVARSIENFVALYRGEARGFVSRTRRRL